MLKIEFVCPLHRADAMIDAMITGLKEQKGICLHKVVFPITEGGDLSAVIGKIFIVFLLIPYLFIYVGNQLFSI